MTDSKTPEWVKEEVQQVMAWAEPLLADDLFASERKELVDAVENSLFSVYDRGSKEGIEEAAKVADRIGNQRSDLHCLSILHGKPAAVDVGYVGYTIRQLLEVKSEDRVEKPEKT